jgi:hypothetical protein
VQKPNALACHPNGARLRQAPLSEPLATVYPSTRQAITLEVTKEIEGQSTVRAPEGTVTRLAAQPKAVNPNERLEWRVPIAAGATATVRYRYKVWVRE